MAVNLPEHMVDRIILIAWVMLAPKSDRVHVLNKVYDWCDRWGIQFYGDTGDGSGYTAYVGDGLSINGKPWLGFKLPV